MASQGCAVQCRACVCVCVSLCFLSASTVYPSLVPDCSLRQGARHHKGTYKGEFFTYLFGFFGSIWAHKGPYGPMEARMGPARALEERERLKKKHTFLYVTHLHQKSSFLTSKQRFCYGFNVLFRFLAEIRPKYG